MDERTPWRALEDPAEGDAETARASRIALSARPLVVALGAVLLGVALVLAAVVVIVKPLSATGVVMPSSPTSTDGGSTGAPLAAKIVVEVTGAVAQPGVYELKPGSRIADAIEAAGGYRPDVDAAAADAALNLASKLSDGQLIRVPKRGEAAGSDRPAGTAAPGLIDLNTATAEQLDTLPGIGPATATKIVASREERAFASVDDLVTRKLVSASVLAKFRDRVTVR